MELLGADQQNSLSNAGLDHRRHGCRAVHETAAGCVEVEGCRIHRTDSFLQVAGVARQGDFWRDGRHHEKVDVGRLKSGGRERMQSSYFGKVGDLNMADSTFADAGSFSDPVVAGVDESLEIGVGQLYRRHAFAPARDRCASLHVRLPQD